MTLSWQGAFPITGLGLAQGQIGILRALPAVGSVIAILAAGWYSQRLPSPRAPSRLARDILGGLCVALGGAALVATPCAPSITAKIALTTLGVALPSVIYVIGNMVVGEATPAGATRRVARRRHRDRRLGRGCSRLM